MFSGFVRFPAFRLRVHGFWFRVPGEDSGFSVEDVGSKNPQTSP